MPIRIESLAPEYSLVAPPQTQICLQDYWEHEDELNAGVPSEIDAIVGGTAASVASASPAPASPDPGSSEPFEQTRAQQSSGSLGSNWSTSLQTLLDRPAGALPSRLVAGGVLFCAAFATWASVSQIDEVGQAPGRLIPKGAAYKVNPLVSGKVANIRVHEGQVVKAGEVIAELDDDIARNRIEALRQEQASYEKELSQTDTLIEKTRLEAQNRLAIATAEIRAQEATIAQAQAKIQSQDTTISQAEERATTSQAVLSELQSDAAAQRDRMTQWKYLVDEGALPRNQLFQAQQQLSDRQRTIIQQTGEIQQARSDAKRMRADLQQVVAEARRLREELAQRYVQGQNSQVQAQQTIQQLLVQRTQILAKIQQSEKLQAQAKLELQQLSLKAPIDGTVLSLNIPNKGEVIQPGQTIAEMASPNVPLVLAAALPTREAGFVKVGDKAQLKFDAYPYQDYGIISGKVVSISPDIKRDEQLGAVYRVEIALDRNAISTKSRAVPLKIGQTATAEIVIRRRTIVDLLLDPIRKLQEGNLSL